MDSLRFSNGVYGDVRVGPTAPLPVAMYPAAGGGTTSLQASSGNVANASAVATLAAAAGKTNYLSNVIIAGAGATAASVVLATITGLLGGTVTIPVAVPAGVTTGIAPLVLNFNPPLPASAANTAIVVTLPALGAGNTNAAVTAAGYQL
jgi:hypothetical protein